VDLRVCLFFQAEDGIRDRNVTGVQTCALPILNILFLLTPKSDCAYVREEDTIRQALERMSAAGFAAVPILAKDGTYRGTLTEGRSEERRVGKEWRERRGAA